MIGLFLVPPIVMQATPPIAVQQAGPNPAAELCRPALAREAGAEIQTLTVDSVKVRGRSTTIRGRLTAFSQMGPAPAGMARTHHLIRVDLSFRCRVKRGRVREAAVNPLNP